jgi:hypothetical protein
MPYIHCLSCGDRQLKESSKQKYPGEHSWFVRGFAKHDMLCDSCNKGIHLGDKCQATTFYTDETHYEPWEEECLDCTDKGTSGVQRVFKESTPTLKVITAFACRDGSGRYCFKVPEIEVMGEAGADLHSVEEELSTTVELFDYLGKEFENDLASRGGEYAFDIHVVGAAEFDRLDPHGGDEPDEEDWDE